MSDFQKQARELIVGAVMDLDLSNPEERQIAVGRAQAALEKADREARKDERDECALLACWRCADGIGLGASSDDTGEWWHTDGMPCDATGIHTRAKEKR